jgi:hypothetical protein
MRHESKKAAQAAVMRTLAQKQHTAVVGFLSQEPFASQILSMVREGSNKVLLTKLLASKGPLKGKDIAANTRWTESAFWPAARGLNGYLKEFSEGIDCLKANGIIIQIPIGSQGGYKVGYYLVCFSTKTREYLDASSTASLLRTAAQNRRRTDLRCPLSGELRAAQDLLEVDRPRSAEWFRKKGPIAADFADKRVHRRKVIDKLRAEVFANPVFMLRGAAATGKTVIVRSLLYELCSEAARNLYYFDIGRRRDFDDTQLINELQTTTGISIIENVHLEPRKAQLIYERFENDSERHVLFTARHLDERYEDMFGESLNQIPSLGLEPLDEANDIINCFCSHSTTPKIVGERIPQIMDVSEGDYWLLAFALEGCAAARGAGEPRGWITGEVQRYIENLATCGDRHEDQYPGILLALSPLYMNEVLTAGSYLIDTLGFAKAALDDLAKRGEITRQKSQTGHVFYGLPHSSRARAYWEHGQEYSTKTHITNPEDWIADYARSHPLNGLVAILSVNPQSLTWWGRSPNSVVRELQLSGEMVGILRSEQSTEAIYRWLECEDSGVPLSLDLIRTLATKLMTAEDLRIAQYCVELLFRRHPEVPEDFAVVLDEKALAARLASTDDARAVGRWVTTLTEYRPQYTKAMCTHMRLDGLVNLMMGSSNAVAACECTSAIDRANEDVGSDLLSRL